MPQMGSNGLEWIRVSICNSMFLYLGAKSTKRCLFEGRQQINTLESQEIPNVLILNLKICTSRR